VGQKGGAAGKGNTFGEERVTRNMGLSGYPRLAEGRKIPTLSFPSLLDKGLTIEDPTRTKP